ncbi:peptide-methionine (S)-S-oxide reductase [Aquimarina sp. AD10]|uniref:peptide-methionine (S)-S-oxide reductase MsrA n=1 Tax=Aquimarina sp. AD10 TaxID=1714849 RepID=UPI000E4BCCB8|nr:peptide-methionine (S)-S-oxide reductase MsrA [Aquimarina sp. AD10]AXT59408.1 peptide-methionine (S)-S-oxide reductase [Aquimarina sp. AD10]RKM92383.1 peptide-methionine (S)-S-oxide reductase [Aquimarina sp. AD10]
MGKISQEIAVLAGGCFWCTEAVFQRVEGVEEVISGYTGGNIKNPAYREITTGRTGHAEAIKLIFDPAIITFKELLEIFFTTHDPTTLNQQGADKGTQYRSAIFYTNEIQQTTANTVIETLNNQNVFDSQIVTQVTELGPFYTAEEYHQNYYNQNSSQGYCQFVINPKLSKLQEKFKTKLKKEIQK